MLERSRATVWITGIFLVVMVVAGIAIDLLFSALRLVPTGSRPSSAVEHAMIKWNYTNWLDCFAPIVFAVLVYMHRRNSGGGEKHVGYMGH